MHFLNSLYFKVFILQPDKLFEFQFYWLFNIFNVVCVLQTMSREDQQNKIMQLSSAAEKLFDLLDMFTDGSKKKAASCWPLQTTLLIFCPVSCFLYACVCLLTSILYLHTCYLEMHSISHVLMVHYLNQLCSSTAIGDFYHFGFTFE